MIINELERAEKAESLFKAGYNCAQAVALAFADLFGGLTEVQVAALTSGFGGGMGRLREVCGAFSACVLVAGVFKPACNPTNMLERTANYRLVQDLAAKFKNINGGSIICRELLGLDGQTEGAKPSERTVDYYHKRPCSKTVYNAALVLAQTINEQNIL